MNQSQIAMWMPEEIRTPRRGLIQLFGNEYYSAELMLFPENALVRVRFETHNADSVQVLDTSGQFVCTAVLDGHRRAAAKLQALGTAAAPQEGVAPKPVPTGRQIMTMLVTPNVQGQHWADQAAAEQLFQPAAQLMLTQFMALQAEDEGGQPVQQTLHSATTDLLQTALAHRLMGLHYPKIKDLLDDEGNEEAWAVFFDRLRELCNTLAISMLDTLDADLSVFVDYTRKALEVTKPAESPESTEGEAV